MIDKQILHYKIIKKLGEGGMGVVYKAEDTKLKREVAIKFLPHYISSNEEERKRFEIEAQAAAALNHPNISTIYAIEESDDEIFIVMEFIDGIELKDKIKSGPIPTSEAINIALQIAEGLEAAHKKGIVHRDIKSQNIMITKDGKVKIMDFGLAKIKGGTQVTKIGSTVGTAAYMSPEQAKGEELDYRTDLWSFGVVLYEMLTRQLPFKGDYDQALMFAILNEQPQPIQRLVADIPSVIIHILDRTLEKEVSLRYQSISEVLIELKRLHLSGSRITSTSSSSYQSMKIPATDRTNRNKKFILLTVLTIVIITIAVVIIFFNPFSSREPVEQLKIVPLNALPGIELQPAISPDGKEVAFAWNGGKGENFNIYVQIIGTYEPQKLTSGNAFDAMPQWTPDGRYIMFVRWERSLVNSSSGNLKYILIPARGGTEKEINKMGETYSPTGPAEYTFTKSGNEIITYVYNKSFQLAVFDRAAVNSMPIDTILHPPANYLGDVFPRISPDGTQMAFFRAKVDFNDFELRVIEYPHGTPKKIADMTGRIGGLSWMPDGKEIIVAAGEKLYRVSTSDGSQQLLAITSGMAVSQPSVSQVGNVLAFKSSTVRYPDLFQLDISSPKRKDVLPVKINSSSMAEEHGKISPDGKKVVFVSDRTGNNQIWVSDIDGTNSNSIASVSETDTPHPSWSPDGLFIVYEDINKGIDVVSSSGGTPMNISKSNNYLPRFSTNGEWIYFCSNKSGDNEIWKISKEGRKEVQVTKNGGEAGYESVDGKWLYYSRFWTGGKEGLFKIPVDGGEEQKVIDKPVHRDAWVLRENGIYYVIETPAKYDMFFFEFKSGKTIKMGDFNKNTTSAYFDVSLKEDWILFSQSEETESDIMLIENFR